MFDIEKLTHSVGWLLSKYGGRLDSAKLVKLMYLADKESLKKKRCTITSDDYCSLDKGPAAVRLCNLIEGKGTVELQKEWDALFKKDGDDIAALKDNIPYDWLSEYETDVLDAIDARFHGMDAEEISEWTHDPANCPEWKDPHGGQLPITKADLLKAIGCDDEYIAFILEEDAIYEAEERGWARYYSEKTAARS